VNSRQAMEVVIGGSIDPSFKRAFQSADKQFDALSKDITALKKQQKLIAKFEMSTVAVDKARAKLNLAQKSVMSFKRSLLDAKKAGDSSLTKKLERDLERAKVKAERLSSALEKNRNTLNTTSSAMRSAGISTQNYARDNDRLSSSLARLQQQQQRIAATASQRQAIKTGFSDMKGQAIGTAATIGSGAFALRPGLDFQTAASTLQAKSSGMSDDERTMLEDQAKELQLKMKFTGAEVLQGQTFLSMAGFNPEQIKQASKGMLDLAASSGMGLAESADISSNILSSFKLDASEMSRVADVLTQTFTSSNVTLEMLGETMKYVAPDANKLGAGIEEVATMVGLLGNIGIQGSMAGTALRSAYARLSAPPKAASKALKKLGIETKTANGDLRSMPVLLEEIYDKTRGMGTGDISEVMGAVFGLEAKTAMQELIEKTGEAEGGFKKLFSKIEDSEFKAELTAERMNNNVSGSFTRLQSSLSAIGQAAFEPFQDSIQSVVDKIGSVAATTAKWMGQHPNLIRNIGMVAGGLLALSTAALVVKGSMLLLGLVGASRIGTFIRFIPIVGGLTRGFGLLASAAPFVVTGIRAIGLALMANPIGAIIGGIAIAATVIIANWETVGPWFASMWSGIKDGFFTALTTIKQGFLNFTPLGMVISQWEPIKGYLSSAWQSIKSISSAGWSALKQGFLNFTPLGIVISNWSSLMSWFQELPNRFNNFGSMMMAGLKRGIISGIKSVTNAISGAASTITGKFKSLLGISSPSRVFMQQGDFVMQGLEQGINHNTRRPVNAISRVSALMLSANDTTFKKLANTALITGAMATTAVSPLAAAQPMPLAIPNTTIEQHNTQAPIVHYEINIYASEGQNAEAIAEQVRLEIEKHEENKAFRQRASYSDMGGY